MFKRSLFFITLATICFAAEGQSNVEQRTVALKSGVTVKYVQAGPREGAPLVLLHGLGDTNRSWSLMLPELAKTHRVYALDQRGHGATSAPACCYALADLAYDVIAFMDAMKIDRASIAGHSLGSFVAQHLAAHYPGRVDRLVLLGSSDTTVGMELLEWLWEQIGAFDRGIPSSFVDQWQSNPTPVDAQFLTQVKKETAAVAPHVWRGITRMAMTEDQRRFLREIRTPTLILWGENDPTFLLAHQQRLQQALPHATFKAYPKVGHNFHWEIPAQVAEDMRAFLEPVRSAGF
jgi:pimeloyl-ACP methyl ester carboxylesterase